MIGRPNDMPKDVPPLFHKPFGSYHICLSLNLGTYVRSPNHFPIKPKSGYVKTGPQFRYILLPHICRGPLSLSFAQGRITRYIITIFKTMFLCSLGDVEKHGPDARDHLADDFDIWEEATGRRKKGNLVGYTRKFKDHCEL